MASAFAEISLQPTIEKWGAVLKSDLRFREGYFFNELKNEWQIKELYVSYRRDKLSVALGNQIVNWGRTDGFNPTNNITPNDYFFLSADPGDQKLSNFMLKLNYRPAAGINLEWIGIPFYKKSNYRFDLFDLSNLGDAGGLFGTFGIVPNIVFGGDLLPERKLKNGSAAFRADFEFPAFGGSVSCFRGYDPYHGIEIGAFDFSSLLSGIDLTSLLTGGFDLSSLLSGLDFSSLQPAVTIASAPYRKTTVGADFAVPAGKFIFRGEAAYNIVDNKDSKPYIPNSDLSYVAGLEANAGGFMLLAQYIGKYTFDFEELSEPVFDILGLLFSSSANPFDSANPALPDLTNLLPAVQKYASETIEYQSKIFNRKIFNQQEKWNHAVSFTAAKSFAYEQLQAEFTGYYNFTSEEWMIRPKLAWKINDFLSLAGGGMYMRGNENTLYSYSSKVMNGGFVELKVSF